MQIQIVYYTDPLCSWSWACEAPWRRLRYAFGDQLACQYRMGGLIPDWRTYDDPVNTVSRPAQMGPQWLHVSQVTGMPLEPQIWHDDPPASSYPACIAFHAALRQGPEIAEAYLRGLREAAMLEGRNIARIAVIEDIVRQTADAGSGLVPSLDLDRFQCDLQGNDARDAFRGDLKEASDQGIQRLPTLVLRRPGNRGVMCVGYRPYEALCSALAAAAPGIVPQRSRPTVAEYLNHWRRLTVRELAEATGLDDKAAKQAAKDVIRAHSEQSATIPSWIAGILSSSAVVRRG